MPERLIRGIAVSPGVAVGPALVWRWEAPTFADRPVAAEDVDHEVARLRDALAWTRDRISAVRERALINAGPEEARIFDAQLMILADPDLSGAAERLIRDNHFSAERAFELKVLEWKGLWSTAGSTLLRERLIDLSDLEVRVLTRLLGADEPDIVTGNDGPVVLVARDLTPSLTVQLDREAILGIATELGTRTSHSAILAHSIGIPAVVGLEDLLSKVESGQPVVLDALAGTLQVRPTEADLESARGRERRHREAKLELEGAVRLPSVTTDGEAVRLRANLDLPEELDSARRGGADGIGLMRTEFLVVGRGRMPTEDEQAALYRRVGEALAGHDVVIRTFDIGGDKFPAGFRATAEGNPFLGWRAIRVCLDQPEVFRPQVRAILRASAHARLKLMIPLVTTVDEVLAVREIVARESDALRSSGIEAAASVPVGVMVETPAAVMIADRLAEVSDFLSVGTNDLVQYTLAVDRGNARLAARFTPHHPAILRSLAEVRAAGARAGIEVSVCGEMASDPVSIFLLLGLGYRVLSVAAPSLPLVRWLVRRIGAASAAECAIQLLNASSAPEVSAAAREKLAAHVDLKLLYSDL